MAKIDKSIGMIDYKTLFNFRKTLNNEQHGNSVFDAFFNADKTKEDGTEGSDFELRGNEIKNFYSVIGDELKQKFEKWYFQKVNSTEICDNILSLNSQNEYTVYDSKKYNSAIKSINIDNIETVLFETPYKNDGSDFIEQITNPYFKSEDVDNYTSPRNLKDIKKDCNHIRKVLQQLCTQYGIDTSALDEENFKIIKKTLETGGEWVELKNPIFDSNNLLMRYVELIRDHNDSLELMNKLNRDVRDKMQNAINERYEKALQNNENLTIEDPEKSPTQEKWSKFAEEYDALMVMTKELYSSMPEDAEILEEKLGSIEQDLLYIKSHLHDDGNGKIDKPAIQRTGNCWLLAGINAFAATEFGKEFLEKNILKDEEKNLFAVHLQEAENKNLPEPNGDGIFVFSEKEILESQHGENGLASGDGDIAAFALAVEKYLKINSSGRLGKNMEHFTDGNSSFRFFEIITGEKRNKNASKNIGIGYKIYQDFGQDTRLFYFDEIFKLAQEKNSAITVGYDAHAFSVVGTEGDCILVQESNLSEAYKKIFELIPDSFPPTYKISKQIFERELSCCSYFRWK